MTPTYRPYWRGNDWLNLLLLIVLPKKILKAGFEVTWKVERFLICWFWYCAASCEVYHRHWNRCYCLIVQGEPGDCHPVGALTIGSSVCQVERHPYHGSKVANAAGGSIQIIKKLGDQVVLKMPSKQEMIIHENCLCVVGRVSNVDR